MIFTEARNILISAVHEQKEKLMYELTGGYRNWELQTEYLRRYQELLKASDELSVIEQRVFDRDNPNMVEEDN